MKRDPYNHKARWERWKKKAYIEGIDGISKANSDIVINYLRDMELGLNIARGSTKGPRAPIRLNTLKGRMIYFAEQFEKRYKKNLSELTEVELLSFFADLDQGVITTKRGKRHQSIVTLANIFKAFWHWHQKRGRKADKDIHDITIDLANFYEKPKWVYLTEEETWQLLNAARFDYRVQFTFQLDSGIRAPTELINVKVSDLNKQSKELNIRDEIAKKGSFGRRIKLMLSFELLLEHIKRNNLKPDDYLFEIKPNTVNKYLQRLAIKLFGDGMTAGGKRYSEISMYDLRHISCCYWLPRYKSESALKYRFGWKKSDKIHYYSELLGMRDTIAEEDLLVDVSKTELEQRITILEQQNNILTDKLINFEKALVQIDGFSAAIKELLEVKENVGIKASSQKY